MSRPRKLPKVLSAAEQARMLDELNRRYLCPHRNRTLLQLMLATGLRAGEVVALRPEHVARKARVAEWERVSPHTLRHTFATQIYTHLVDDALEEALRSFRPGRRE